jgi:hypothetical protein
MQCTEKGRYPKVAVLSTIQAEETGVDCIKDGNDVGASRKAPALTRIRIRIRIR